MATSFVYFSSGNERLHNRSIFSIFSLLSYYPLQAGDKILVYTDQIGYYKTFFPEVPIEYYHLTQAQIEEQIGKQGLIHRVKIWVIEHATQQYPQNKIFYIDSDTFFHYPFAKVIDQIDAHTTVMHKLEYPMSFLGTYPPQDKNHFRAVYDFLAQNPLLIRGEQLHIHPDHFNSWNAGIIGLHPSHFSWLREVYEFTDQLYDATRNHACEQYAFSYFLQKRTQLIDCQAYNCHYWHRVEKKIVDEFLSRKLTPRFARLSFEQQQYQVKKWASYLLKHIPKHAYMHRYKAMIAFQERRFWQGYKESLKTLLANPMQDITFFKDVAYHTKKMLMGNEK